jgi:glycosyltransferase involved in cell wall biosynthesis
MDLSVIMPTRDRGAQVLPTLFSILADENCDLEVILIDQSASPATEQAVQEAGLLKNDRLLYRRSPTTGASHARNEGIECAQADLLAHTDDDCIVSARWPTLVCERFRLLPDMDVFFGDMVARSGAGDGWIPEFMTRRERRVNAWSRAEAWGAGVLANLVGR